MDSIKKKTKFTVISTTNFMKRIHSPYNKVIRNNKSSLCQTTKPAGSIYGPTGLSSKERSFVIGSCQRSHHRYNGLKEHAKSAIANNKIFYICGTRNGAKHVRKALLERGWVEKIPASKMNLRKVRSGYLSNKKEVIRELERLFLSNMISKYAPSFVWHSNYEINSSTTNVVYDRNTIVNKLNIDSLWTTKQGLCSSMKMNCWFYIDGVAEVSCPRSFNSFDVGETEEFINDYYITACTNLLKWIVSMVDSDKDITKESGKVSIKLIAFAIHRCKGYLLEKQNDDIDKIFWSAKKKQWHSFLRNYRNIISNDGFFKIDKNNKLNIYLEQARYLVKQMHIYRPELKCEGFHNIWIIKPTNLSRGNGITIASQLEVIVNMLSNTNTKYVIQKYIEEPLLIHGTKFDLRQYYLVTSTYPLVIWMYGDCYLKFSSQKYSLTNFHKSIHLTNHAVQKRFKNCVDRHFELPSNNMWDLARFKEYLKSLDKNEKEVWDGIIYPGMCKSVVGVMLNCQDTMLPCDKHFELYGCDFILDNNFKPWLIEINSNPDLNCSTKVTSKICPKVIHDTIKVVIDRIGNPQASTGNFTCIYKQTMPIQRCVRVANLALRGFTLPNDYFLRECNKTTRKRKKHDMCTIRVPLDSQRITDARALEIQSTEP